MRCFVAAWPDDETRAALEYLLDRLRPDVPQARPMQPRNLHLTLAFIGDIDTSAASRVARACESLTIDSVDWSIDSLGWFPRARVMWAGGQVNERLGAVVDRARTLLDGLGVGYDRKPFVAHVTLFRDARRFDRSGPLESALPWHTAHVALYAAARDERGPLYRRVERTESPPD
jgi:RNA 2',3'-cyclic 3'-phosphodiesterase